MDSEQNRSDDYWMGVRDALRMVDSFTKWSRSNKSRAKPLEDFLHEGLVAAAKRCESCLHKQLGVAFSSEEAAKDFMETNDIYETPPTPVEEPETILEGSEFENTPPEIILEPEGEDSIEDVPIVIESEQEEMDTSIFDDGVISIDSMGSSDSTLGDESLASSGQPRDFSSDFDLVEPDPLIISSESDGIETPPSEEEDLEDIVIEETLDETEFSFDDEEISVERPSYGWDSPDHDSPDDRVPLEEPPAPAAPEMNEIPAPPKDWSPMDDPSPATLIEDEVTEESDDLNDQETPPPPPLPPETEESEEERRRRARRLFFGG
ncbi:MAG: hypothetical protein P1Q69_13090 [Candidatus Thorarchaeota archaeon]|nr:hypothetical protein [Candidatus Thorarchaeota archaeon]